MRLHKWTMGKTIKFVKTFASLLILSRFRRRHLAFIQTLEDLDMIQTIGAGQAENRPLTFKLLCLEGFGSVATVQRRLGRLKRLGIVNQSRAPHDKRNLVLTVSPKACRLVRQLGRVMHRIWCKKEDRRKAQRAASRADRR